MSQSKVVSWRCTVCGYIHEGAAPPDECPVCGVGPEDFEPAEREDAPAAPPAPEPAPTPAAGRSESSERRIVIVGAGIAGLAAAEAARHTDADVEIVLLSKEPHLPYMRLNLTRFVAGEVARESLPIHSGQWFEEHLIECRQGAEAVSIALQESRVVLRGGGELPYAKLILANGAHAFAPPIPGSRREGVMALRTVEDAERLIEAARNGERCVCIGGGILGLETAGGLAQRGASVAVLESCGWLMPRQLPEAGGEVLRDYVERIGVQLMSGVGVEEIVGDERCRGVRLAGGEIVPADWVVLNTGIRSNTFLAAAAGLEIDRGIVVDDRLTSSHPDVLAAGDSAQHRGIVYGLWSAAQIQGRIAGRIAAGAGDVFAGIPPSTTLKVLGVDVASIGRVEPAGPGDTVIEERGEGLFRRFVFEEGRLVGAVFVGDAAAAGKARKAIVDRTDLSAWLAGNPAADAIAERLASE